MSKKELVKEVIDNLINEGVDFEDLTQGELVKRKELEGVSKTTIKRAKKEYKVEKIVVKGDYKEQAIKRKIYKHLDRHPKTSLSDLRDAMPNILPAKVAEYYQIWTKKQQKAKKQNKKKKPTVTPRKLREMVFGFLDRTPSATLDQLVTSFPGANKSSLTSYFGHWKKKQRENETVKVGGLYQAVITFLDKNPDATIPTLKASFSDVPEKSLNVYHNLWIKKREAAVKEPKDESIKKIVQEIIFDEVTEQKIQKDPAGKAKMGSQSKNASSMSFSEMEATLTKQELIETLKSTIQAQKSTIDALDEEYSLLKSRQSDILLDLEQMSNKEVQEIRNFVTTYLVGLKKKNN